MAAGTGKLGIAKETVLAEIEKRVPEKYIEMNKDAFFAGYEEGEKHEIK